MTTRPFLRVSVAAALVPLCLSGCATNTLGISPATILATVIANVPRDGTSTRTTTTSTSSTGRPRARIPASPAASSAAARVLHTAESYIGVRYTWGGNNPNEGFDCSGFTKWVFAKQGITLPRTSREQARVGIAVAPDFAALIPGDIMLFAEPGADISHVAIYAGNGRIIHSSSSNGGVGYTDLNAGGEWFYQYMVAARRLQ